MAKPKKQSGGPKMYGPVMELVFESKYRKGARVVDFTRTELEHAAAQLGVDPKNVGDIPYTFRYRRELPESIRDKAPAGRVWIIRGAGAAQYRLCAVPEDYAFIRPREGMATIRIPDATPGVIAKYALDDEQALLAKVRYNRLIDIFLGIACYPLQSHLRTQVPHIGQVETDEIYIGIDKQGAHYAIPVQAKGGTDKHSIVQVEQDFALCADKFPMAVCRPIAAQFLGQDVIALFSFSQGKEGAADIADERHYVLVAPEELSDDELKSYRKDALK